MRPFNLREGCRRYNPLNLPKKKVCRTCKSEKGRDEFNTAKSNSDGLQSDCRVCQNEKGKVARNKKKVDKNKYFDFD